MRPPTPEETSGYLGAFPVAVTSNGRELEATVHMALVHDRVTCVGLDIRSFTSPEAPNLPDDPTLATPVGDDWVELTSPLMRGIRVAEVVEAGAAACREYLRTRMDELFGGHGREGDELVEELKDELTAEPPRKPRGPKRQLDDQALREVVAPAYRLAGRRPVQAVREALETSGLLRPPVTPDQARKAVVAARARGFIPPANRGRQRSGGQS